MAIIQDKKEFVTAVSVMVQADMGIEELLFPRNVLHPTETIEYDTATVEGVAPSYNSFSNTANVVLKDGKDVVTLNPVNFNDSISKEVIDSNSVKFGQNEYGEGTVDAITQSALDGTSKLRLNQIVGRKKLIYEALTTHQITKGYESTSGKQDIVFPVPAANKTVFDGLTAGQLYWSVTASSKPLTNLVTAYAAMIVKPSAVIMNDATYSNFYDSAEVLTVDNTSTGTKKNFTTNDNVDANAQFYLAGRMSFKGVILDIYVERQRRKISAGSYTPFMANGYVALASPVGEMHYGGIPVSEPGGVRRITAEFDVDEFVTSNPPQHNLVVRTAPVPVLKVGEAYYSMKVEA